MASLIPGFEYDIFISYRQKDNKYDGWVTEFVDNLKRELEATFKEEVSVYFDINPHDGLLETHDVGDSLKEKLKCLVFIPIISRTYCDPKSFAWEHEFKAFIELASQDQFGLKVKLPNGNVANRVLPVRIHELDAEDIKLCESTLGSVLRGVEFIYKEPGVNRPLTNDDKEKKNLNRTRYRNQINKVANAIKDIISGLRTGEVVSDKGTTEHQMPWEEEKKEKIKSMPKKPTGLNMRKLLSGIIPVAIILVLLGIYVYPKLFKRDNLRSSDGRISVAVMPFQNLTNDTTWNVWQSGIQDILINSLTNSEELKIRQSKTINSLLQSKGINDYASLTPSVASAISKKLDANIFIYGSIIQTGSAMRLNIELINSKTEEVFKSFQEEETADRIISIIDTLSWEVKNFLIISKMKREESKLKWEEFSVHPYISYSPTKSADAFRYFLYGTKAYVKLDFKAAIDYCLKAIEIDSNLYLAYNTLSNAYFNLGMNEQGGKWLRKYYSKLDMKNIREKTEADYQDAFYNKTNEAFKYAQQLIDIDDRDPDYYYMLGDSYFTMLQYEKAIPEFEKSLELHHKLDIKSNFVMSYCELGIAYHRTGQYKKEKKLYKKAEKDFPDNAEILDQQAWLSLTEGDTIAANRYIQKWLASDKGKSSSEADIANELAYIYDEGGIPDKAEEYNRQALSLEPEKPGRMSCLARFLIDKDRNINEGMELVDKALILSPDNYRLLHMKGWGLYKQGKYKEALEILQKSWNLRTKYDPEIYFHLEEAKKAVVGQK